jgi:hypothetical protein
VSWLYLIGVVLIILGATYATTFPLIHRPCLHGCDERIKVEVAQLRYFFYGGLTSGHIAGQPLPILVEPESAIRQPLRSRDTLAKHEFAGSVQMMIAHVELT